MGCKLIWLKISLIVYSSQLRNLVVGYKIQECLMGNFRNVRKELRLLLFEVCLCLGYGLINFLLMFQFFLIFRKVVVGEFEEGFGFSEFVRFVEIDVDEVGVGGVVKFFEVKVNE